MDRFIRAFLLLFCLLKGSTLFAATTATWNVDAVGPTNWSTAANWTPNTAAPNGIDDAATFGSVLTLPTGTISVDPVAGITVGTIQLDNVNSYVIAGPNVLIFSATSGTANVTVTSLSGSHTISADTRLDSNLTVTQNSTGVFTISGTITESGGSRSLTTAGSQITSLTDASNSYSGGTTISTGTLRASADGVLGDTGGDVTINTGTFQAGASFSTAAARGFTLSGAASFDSNGNTLTIAGIIGGSGSLTKTGSGTLVLSGSNTYMSGTTISLGTLSISADGNLGKSGTSLSIGNTATLQTTASFDSTRPVTLTGSATINTQTNTIGLSGNITGTGSLTKAGTGTLTLTGDNDFSQGITVSAGTLQGDTGSLPGDIVDNATLIFNQTSNGTYSGSLSGTGAMTIKGGAVLTMSGSSSGYTGTTEITGSTQLVMNGNLSGSALTIDSGSILSGSGSVGATTNSGEISPGTSGSGTLDVSGAITFNVGSSALIQIAPTSNGKISATGNVNLSGNGALSVTPTSGFYGLSASYVLVSGGSFTGEFASNTVTDSNFLGTFTYHSTFIQLDVQILRPFQNFSFANQNERAVGFNIDDINASGSISSDMSTVIDTLAGQSDATINDALDQMHPAAMSAFAEQQAELGGQLLSLFHRKPSLACGCSRLNRVWVEPFGNWLEEKQQGEEIGFHTTTRGVAFGYDREFFDFCTFGVACAWSASDLSWSLGRGHAYTDGFFGGFYSDISLGNYYFGASFYIGGDWYDVARDIHFTTIDRQAKSHYHGLDLAAQCTAAYYFGTPACLFYPYGTVDYLYLKNASFSESGADSLNLDVDNYASSTLRSEAGLALQIIDKNYRETICISPFFSFGWVMEWPLHRDDLTSTFQGQTISFSVKGWDETWQLLNLHFGLGITYRCFTLDSQYIADISPDGGSPLFNQRANFRLSYNF